MSYTIELLEKSNPSVYLVREGASIVGMLEKYKDDRHTRNPWKAFWSWGVDREYLGAFYAPRAGWPAQPGGGQRAALAAIRLRQESLTRVA